MVKLADIARAAGCSITAVSRVMNPGDPSSARVSDETRKRVLYTARELGYQPNRNAEFLKRGRTPEIGVFLREYNNNLILDIVEGCSAAVAENGFSLSFYFNLAPDNYSTFLKAAQLRNYYQLRVLHQSGELSDHQ